MTEKARFQQLIERAGKGDESGFEELQAEYGPSLRVWIDRHIDRELRRRIDADDILQSVCFLWWRTAPELDFQDERAFRAWLRTMALHVLHNRAAFHRAGRRSVHREAASGVWTAASGSAPGVRLEAPGVTPAAAAIGQEVLDRIEAALGGFPAETAEAYREVRLRGRSAREVAEGRGVSVRTVERCVARAEEGVRLALGG